MGTAIFAVLVISSGVIYYLIRLRRKKREEAICSVYINLTELYGCYFWIVSLNRYQNDPEIQEKVKKLTRLMSDNLKTIIRLPFARHLQELLSSDSSGKTVNPSAQYQAYGTILEQMASYINKKCPAAARRIEEKNLRLQGGVSAEGDIFNPASLINWKPPKKRDHGRQI